MGFQEFPVKMHAKKEVSARKKKRKKKDKNSGLFKKIAQSVTGMTDK
jgi:hypothetical protein